VFEWMMSPLAVVKEQLLESSPESSIGAIISLSFLVSVPLPIPDMTGETKLVYTRPQSAAGR
jgi:hypothetical protein